MDWSRIHTSERFTPITPLLALCSLCYSAGVRLHHLSWRFRTRQVLPGFTLSVGNLTVGGTGKTPATCMLAQWARDEGFRPAVLSRGYGGAHGKNVLEVSDGNAIKAGPGEAGDEPFLMARQLEGVPVIVAGNRYDAGRLAHEQFGSRFFILDDGFQHLVLKRDLDVVLMDASRPFGNGFLLPWGPLREPVGYLKRAHAFVLTRCNGEGQVGSTEDMLGHAFPGRPVFRSHHAPGRIVFPNREGHGAAQFSPEFLKGKRVAAFAGIARPGAFEQTLKGLGAEVVLFKGYRDHHKYTGREIQGLVSGKGHSRADYLLTTEKDWVRMEETAKGIPDMGYLTVEFVLSDRDAFFDLVRAKAKEAGVY